MAAALKLLLRQGYRRVRLEDVAAEAGVSKATIYHYFDNKDDLLTQTVTDRMAAKDVAVRERLAAAGGTAADRLRLFLRQFWDVALTVQAGLWQRLLVREIVTEAPAVFEAWGRGLVQRWRIVRALIEEGQQHGEFRREADAEVAARLIISALSHQALFHVHFGIRRFAPCAPDHLFDAALEQFLQSLRPAGPRLRPGRSSRVSPPRAGGRSAVESPAPGK
jgi:AcrR family transcriptional regulator